MMSSMMRLSLSPAGAAPAAPRQRSPVAVALHSSTLTRSSSPTTTTTTSGRINPPHINLTPSLRPRSRTHALPTELLESSPIDLISSGAATLGCLAATLFFSMLSVEQRRRSTAEAELTLAKSKQDDLQAQIYKLESELERERKATRDLEMYKKRYADSSKEIYKLEKALEMKDGQQEAFMVIAQRQIKYLEDMVKELRKMPVS